MYNREMRKFMFYIILYFKILMEKREAQKKFQH